MDRNTALVPLWFVMVALAATSGWLGPLPEPPRETLTNRRPKGDDPGLETLRYRKLMETSARPYRKRDLTVDAPDAPEVPGEFER